MKFKVRYTYDATDKSWIVVVPSVKGCHTFGRSLRQARSRVREALAAALVDLPETEAVRVARSAELVEEFAGPKVALDAVRKALSARALAKEAAAVAEEATKAAVRAASTVFSLRDAGDLFGLSHQRVQQLTKSSASSSTDTPRAPRAAPRGRRARA